MANRFTSALGAIWDGIYGPRGAAEDIRHKMEEAVYGRTITPWSHDPSARAGKDIHGNGPELDDQWNRMDPATPDDLNDSFER